MKFRHGIGRNAAYHKGYMQAWSDWWDAPIPPEPKRFIHVVEVDLLLTRMRAMYAALVQSGSIVRVPEAHGWIEEIGE